jgi:predicted PurR-regulated permease PerM
MLTEIIVYIALFAVLFSSAFGATFQIIEGIKYLQVQKETVDNLYFFQSRLNSFVQSSSDWENVSQNTVEQLISNSGLSIESFSSQIIETATSSSRVLLLTLGINKKTYTFSYVQEK